MLEISRRAFLQVTAGGAGALAAAMGIQQAGKLIPYVVPPEEIKPGIWATYATTCRECPAGCGMWARHRDGRATKAEGNPLSPVNAGTLCARGQASMQGLYDPDRLTQPLLRPQSGVASRHTSAPHEKTTWADAIGQIAAILRDPKRRVHIISDLQTGALAEVMTAFAGLWPRPESPNLQFYEPFNYQPLRRANAVLFGLDVIPRYRLQDSRYILSFGADFLETWLSPVEFARGFSRMHEVRPTAYGQDPFASPPRLDGKSVYIGPRVSMTAQNAEECFLAPSGCEAKVALAILEAIIAGGLAKNDSPQLARAARDLGSQRAAAACGLAPETIDRLAREFAAAKGAVALACPTGATGESAQLASMAAAMLNYAVGSIGTVVDFSQPHALSRVGYQDAISNMLASLGQQDVVILHNANPMYSLPAGTGVHNAATIIYMGYHLDETAKVADYVLPIDYPLEAWGDYEPYAGVHGLIQPTTARLHDTRNAGDVLIALAQALNRPIKPEYAAEPPEDFQQWLSGRWQQKHTTPWKDALRAGGNFQTDAASDRADAEVEFKATSFAPLAAKEHEPTGNAFNLWLWPSVFLFDGRGANRGWLQEAPDPTSQATWGSWFDIHPRRANELALQEGDIIEVRPAGQDGTSHTVLRAPVRVTESVSPDVLALAFGQGHTALGEVARDVGVNAFDLQPMRAPGGNFASVIATKVEGQAPIHVAIHTQQQHGRELFQWSPASQVLADKPGTLRDDHFHLPLPEGYTRNNTYEPHDHKKHRWCMVIDLDRCIGCGACAVACYAENNIYVVGPAEVDRGREMAWLKVVPYQHEEDPNRVGFLPLACQHCDSAPCEPVCPVYAAVHNDEGLNAQVYNRCIGTRYCNNNCPYKVRRFNWFNRKWTPPLEWQLNPEVSVRSRGVMEKCSMCIQRIRLGEHKAAREGRPLKDGEFLPACAQTCPTMAIMFGDLLDPQSLVTRLARNDPRRYQVLGELNTLPGVIYLRRVDRSQEEKNKS